MFERRLKVFLAILSLVTLTLVLRAAQVQVVQHKAWEERAQDAMTHRAPTDTMRGTIRDVKGLPIAIDEQCVDACLDYRALAPVPDNNWVTEVARGRLRDRLGSAYTDAPLAQRKVMVETEKQAVGDDLRAMWKRLADITGRDLREIEDVRLAIVEKVKMRRRFVWYYNYEAALQKHKSGVEEAQTRPSSLWHNWLLDDTQDAPELDNFELRVFEETARHAIVRDIPQDVQAELGKHSERFPGLELRTGNRRLYPYGEAGAHLLGRMSKVTKKDIDTDPKFYDELRQYQPNDLKGRGGLEQLFEQELRGVRGEIRVVDGREVPTYKPEKGKDVKVSIDIELQQEVEALFNRVPIKSVNVEEPDYVKMHGAAVVIDLASAEVRVLASAPGFDPNRFEERYANLADPANLDLPLMNRATTALREPGSTVKPIVGIAGVASGVRRADEGYECTGYMTLNGKATRNGRCWVNSMFHNTVCSRDCKLLPCPTVAHHKVPWGAEHPTGFLTLADALERSCNPYFESIAHALGPKGLSEWYRKFGLGELTYIGIREERGLLPDRFPMRGPSATFSTWSSGIGQGPISATPLQMANVAATIARGGVWVRPTLIARDSPARPAPTTQAASRVDLGVPPEALRAVREGMFRVVHTKAGSGIAVRRKEFAVAGKTGTAEAARILVNMVDPKTGKPVLDEKTGKAKKALLKMSNPGDENLDAVWYRGTGREGGKPHHSWFIGYAPAENPQVAFAVLVEYGGSGGGAAGAVANKIIEKCIAHGTLTVPAGAPIVKVAVAVADTDAEPATAPAAEGDTGVVANRAASVATPLAPSPEVELLRPIEAAAQAVPAATRAAD